MSRDIEIMVIMHIWGLDEDTASKHKIVKEPDGLWLDPLDSIDE